MHPIWVSPLQRDNYAEYQDEQFLEAVGLRHLSSKLSDFWPPSGPVWDSLATVEGKNGSQGVILLEAKSHILELGNPSYACKAKSRSRDKITNTLTMVKEVLGIEAEADWLGQFYQYANRIAHLYFLNSAGQIPTWMVFLYFVGDTEQNGPLTVAEWIIAVHKMRSTLGLPQSHLFDQRIVTVFAPVAKKEI